MNQKCNHPLNRLESKKILFEKNGYKIFECEKSGHRFIHIKHAQDHVSEVYCDEYFFAGKTGYPDYLNQKELLYNYGKDYAKTLAQYLKPGKVLDTGCAAGFILKGFVDSGWEGTGVEPNNTMAKYGRKELNLNIATASFEAFESDENFDLINMIQVIGHFYSIDKVMSQLHKYLKQNGMVLVESWNMKSGYAKLMGKHWHEYSPPSVVRWFSDDTLSKFFKQHGFTLIAKGHPAKKIKICHALSLIEEKSFNFTFKKRIFHKIDSSIGKYNLNYPFLDLNWYLFQLDSSKETNRCDSFFEY